MIPRSEAARELAAMAEATAPMLCDDCERLVPPQTGHPCPPFWVCDGCAAKPAVGRAGDGEPDGPELSELGGAEWVASCRICPGEEDDGEADGPVPVNTAAYRYCLTCGVEITVDGRSPCLRCEMASPDPVVWPVIAAGVGVVVAFAGCWVAAVVFGGK